MLRVTVCEEREVEEGPPLSRRRRHTLERHAERAGVARCPLCRHRLVARMGLRGPGFVCECRADCLAATR
jgi:hypothetical protein